MKQVKLAVKRILSYLPSKLPVGVTEFNSFAQDILDLSGNYADKDSMTFAIASMVIHLPAGKGYASKNHFIQGLRKSAANQVASQVFQDIKTRQEAVLKKQAEDTAAALAKAASDESKATEEEEATNS